MILQLRNLGGAETQPGDRVARGEEGQPERARGRSPGESGPERGADKEARQTQAWPLRWRRRC